MNLKEKVSSGVSLVKTYWKTPPLGNYMNYKQIVSLAGGGIGLKAIITCVEGMLLSVGNNLIGNVIGITPTNLYIIYILGVLSSFPLTAVRANIIDNTRNKKGKYRPYLMSMGIPTALLAIGFVWMPYESMSQIGKCVVVLLFNVGFQFFYQFFYEVYNNFVVVLSPNTQERANVSSIKAVADSLAPSIINIVVPLFGKMITGENTLVDIRIYRFVYPPILIIGMLIGIIVYVNVEEKIVQAKTHVIQIRFADAFRAVVKNKYFWIISLAGWLGFLEGAYGNILVWLYSYQKACGAGTYALITTIYGNASFWGMIISPFMIKRFGKRNVLVFTNILNIIFIAAMYPVIKYSNPAMVIWLVLICLFANGVVGSFAHILTPSLNGDIRDYQQYVTGERIDGMFSAVGLVGSIITLATSSVLPALYERSGINMTHAASLGFKNAYDVLYDVPTFHKVLGVLIAASVVGAALNVIPYFFYDLSEVKQKAMIRVLKIRAMFEDYGNGMLMDDAIVESIDYINTANDYIDKKPEDLKAVKAKIGEAKKGAYSDKESKKAAVKAARKALHAARDFNDEIEIAKIVTAEMNKFNTPVIQEKVRIAAVVSAGGLSGLTNVPETLISDAKMLPKNTPEEKEYRKAMVESASQRVRSSKLIVKKFDGRLVEYDASIFDELDSKEAQLDNRQKLLYSELADAKKAKDSAAVKSVKSELKALKNQHYIINGEYKKATKEQAMYYSCAKPYLDAVKIIAEQENYKHLEKIASMYDEAKVRDEQAKADEAKKEAERKAAEAAFEAELKAKKLKEKQSKK